MFKKITFITLFIVALSSCKKEKSVDTIQSGVPPVFIGSNCTISQILAVDSLTGIGLEAHNISFNTSGVASRVQMIDSILNDPYVNDILSIRNDTIIAGNSGYFVKNNKGQIRLFRGKEDPSDPASELIDITFTYNAAGFLIKTEYAYTASFFPLLRSIYTYTGNNLTQAVTESLFPATEKVIDARLTYSAQPVRNFIYTFPDAFYLVPYLPALPFGNKSANALQRVETRYYDNGTVTDSAFTNYKNYKLSNDGYVLEFFAEGDYQDGMGIYFERTKFKYFCK
jgi:hypothetical protein